MVTSIQIHEKVKKELDYLKQERESYEQVIERLIERFEKQKRTDKNLLIESCKVMAEESLKITKEFEAIEDLSRWEW